MDYRSRWYASALGRFTQPDTIIPNPLNPQSFNRYAYVFNNPIVFTDPSGHNPWTCFSDPSCATWYFTSTGPNGYGYGGIGRSAPEQSLEEDFNVTIEGAWTDEDKAVIEKDVRRTADFMVGILVSQGKLTNPNPAEVWNANFYPTTIGTSNDWSYCGSTDISLECNPARKAGQLDEFENQGLVIHELMHVWDFGYLDNAGAEYVRDNAIFTPGTPQNPNGFYVSGPRRGVGYQRTIWGYVENRTPYVQHLVDSGLTNAPWGEDYADIGMNAIIGGFPYGGFANDPAGAARYEFAMQMFIELIISP